MRKKGLVFLIFLLFLVKSGEGKISSLSQIFLLGYGIQDSDKDNLPDKISFQIIIPDTPTTHEIIVASDIAARANLESLVVDFSLVRKESEIRTNENLENPIFIGTNLRKIKQWAKEGKINLSSLKPHQGLVTIVSFKGQKGMVLVAGSEEALLRTGRAFFLRWPYFWDIWGREQGETYFSLERDLARFLKEEKVSLKRITIKSVLYEFPISKPYPGSLKRLRFKSGEIKNLILEIDFIEKKSYQKAFKALERLREQHRKGSKTNVLSYSGCARITFVLRHRARKSQVTLPRVGYPKRILTPSYKALIKSKIPGKNFDLLGLFSTEGFYSDSDKDRILDKLDTSVILSQKTNLSGVTQLASRLVLATSGASFPIIYLDKEIENRKALVAPILIGQENSLNKELIKTGKLKLPALERGWGMAKVVPQAFNKSNVLTIVGSDSTGLEKILDYLSKTFPYFDDYKEGNPQIQNIPYALEEFFNGERGSAEAFFLGKIEKFIKDIQDNAFESFKAKFFLPHKNQKFQEFIKKRLQHSINTEDLEIKTFNLKESKKIFEKEKEFTWEGDEALRLIQEKIKTIKHSEESLKISLGVSESPKIREKLKSQIESHLIQNNIDRFEVEVLSTYKQGFFWLLEKVLPALKGKDIHHLTIRFAEEKENFSIPKRFYTEPSRWLQELYPVDEFISREIHIPLERIIFEMKEEKDPVYEVLAYDEENNLLFKKSFSPRTREIPFLEVLPEWGKVKITTGWLKINRKKKTLVDIPLKSDLEKFWQFYQEKILPQVYSYILKKTANEPSFSKQPYFKRLLIEMWFSEPDYKLGLDEEIVSSLEAIHDEIYFDTLDFLRGITEVDIEDESIHEDTSRYSAPGNILPLIHPSLEGGQGKVRIVFEDWQARSPQLHLTWKEKGKEEIHKKIIFPEIKSKSLRFPSFIYNGLEERIENLFVKVEVEKKTEYLQLIDLIASYRELRKQGILPAPFRFLKLKTITLAIKFKELEKEEPLPISYIKESEEKLIHPAPLKTGSIVPTDEIISPNMCLEIVELLSHSNTIKSYVAGESYEKRKIPVLEIFLPQGKYISIPRLITCKPTLYLSGRQHANEVSSTNYILKLAELLAKDKFYQDYTKKMNFVLHPMENPDGAALAYRLQKMTPFHSLHAGRYSSLGIDIGYQVNAAKPLLPEAKVRKNLYNRWLPDIYLNLHGYPSHEWVQQFSNYSPYLFRDYWIPRGWFAYFRGLSLPLYQKWKEAATALRTFIIEEMLANNKISKSNKKFYDRYFRWAARWQPHLSYLDLYDGLNLYAKRRSSRENRLSSRRRITFAEETPELMDETAHGTWLDFLCEQGLTYLKAHIKYLTQVRYEIERIEEETQDRIHIQFIRSRPGEVKAPKNK